MEIGARVKITNPGSLTTTAWWPSGEVTGIVQKFFKNGSVAVAIDQLRNGSEDGRRTLHFDLADLEEIR